MKGLEERARERIRHFGLLAGALVVANVVLSAANLAGEMRPDLAVRTDVTGHSDVVVIGEAGASRTEVRAFVKEACLSLFEGARETEATDEAYLKPRVRQALISQAGREVGRGDADDEDRRSVSIEQVKVLTDAAPWRVEVRMRFYGVGEIVLPATAAEKANQGTPYGVVATVEERRRTTDNPSGLWLRTLTPVML